MFASLRAAMTWIHTWIGLAAGYLLVTVFFFGTLSVFDREIDRWAVPETRFAPQPMPSWRDVLEPTFARIAETRPVIEALAKRRPGAGAPPRVRLVGASAFRTTRDPSLALYADLVAEYPDGTTESFDGLEATIDPRSGAPLPSNAFAVGTKFFYPMHIHFHLGEAADLGYWLVGVAAFGMLVALVSGVVIHRKLFAELFTFRPWKSAQRATLDLHDLTGVLALPFHFAFAFTGLVVFAGVYLPVSSRVLAPLATAHERREEAARGFARDAARVPAPLASIDAMILESGLRWGETSRDAVGYLVVRHPGDANASVSVYRAGKDRVTMFGDGVHFAGATGEVLARDPPPSTIAAVVSFLTALHLEPFEQWTLRWLYVGGGLAGCVCLATGMIFFVRKRRTKHPRGARWADAVAIGTVTGTVVATLALLVANRALPPRLESRVGVQQAVFWLAWLGAFVHAAWRSGPRREGLVAPAWREQCWGIAALALAAIALNAITTGDHLGRTLPSGPHLPVAGVDLSLLVVALAGALSARRLRRSEEATDA